MKTVTQPAMTVLYSSHQTTIMQLSHFVGTIAKQLYAEATRLGLLVSGPQYWMYHGMDGNPETVFTLEIALPVQGETSGSSFPVKELLPFHSLVHTHAGAWEKMPESYQQLMAYIGENKIVLSGEYREVYLNVDFTHPENNRVEIQAGIL